MQRLSLSQTLSQKLSPQQIQFIKLLQVPTAELEGRIEEELEENPALEEGVEEPTELADDDETSEEATEKTENKDDEINVEDYLRDDDISGYKMQGDGENTEDRDMPLATSSTLTEQLFTQLSYIKLNDYQTVIAKQLIGSIENDGYIRRDIDAILNDLAFAQNIETTHEELEEVLQKIQEFDPPGIAARNLKECLLLQLARVEQNPNSRLAIRIIDECFTEFTKKHYQKIIKKLDLEDEEDLKQAIEIITKLNPKPGGTSSGMVKTQ